MVIEIIHKDPSYPNSDLECACGMVNIWSNRIRMYKECPEHKKETEAIVQSIVNAINSGEYPLFCKTHNIQLKDCKDKEDCKFGPEVIPL